MTASRCILVADDQPAVREALRILLTNAGYRVELATSPREVLRLIKEQEFALALLDLNYARDTTSGEEGLEVVQQLQKIETGEFERLGSSRPRRADVRLISATNADLVADVESGRFRRDLYFRLNTVEICLPALRHRAEDIPVLARYFLRFHAERYRKTLTDFSSEADRLLLRHPWPGNVRELDHTVERAVLMADSNQIEANDLGLVPTCSATGSATAGLEQLTMEEIERLLIKKALDRYSGNVRRAAEALGLSRSTFYRRLQEFGL
jgi:DNA-binding NtrC family response regulator